MALLFLIYYFRRKMAFNAVLLKLRRGNGQEMSPKIYFRHTIIQLLADENSNDLIFILIEKKQHGQKITIAHPTRKKRPVPAIVRGVAKGPNKK